MRGNGRLCEAVIGMLDCATCFQPSSPVKAGTHVDLGAAFKSSRCAHTPRVPASQRPPFCHFPPAWEKDARFVIPAKAGIHLDLGAEPIALASLAPLTPQGCLLRGVRPSGIFCPHGSRTLGFVIPAKAGIHLDLGAEPRALASLAPLTPQGCLLRGVRPSGIFCPHGRRTLGSSSQRKLGSILILAQSQEHSLRSLPSHPKGACFAASALRAFSARMGEGR